MNITIDVFGEQVLARQLLGIGDNIGDARPAFMAIEDELVESERRQFASAGAYGSGGWAPLAPSTIARKQKLGINNGILVATGDLRDSLTLKSAGNAVREITESFIIFGSTVGYGVYHQLGGSGLPRRRPMELPEGDRREIPKILQRWFMTGTVMV